MDEECFKETLRRSSQGGEIISGSYVILEKIKQMDLAYAESKAKGNLREAVGCLEQSFVLKLQMHGAENEAVSSVCCTLAQSYNTLAMRLVEEEHFDEAYELLKKAEILTEDEGCLRDLSDERLKISAITLNNLGCFFKRKGKLQAALHYLNKALAVETQTTAAENPAGTLLNLCATLSQLTRHSQALTHAEKAIELLKNERVEKSMPEGTATKESAANTSFLAIAYHNQAVEQEFLGLAEALQSYRQACVLADKCWGAKSPMAMALRKNLKAFKAQGPRCQSGRSSSSCSARKEYKRRPVSSSSTTHLGSQTVSSSSASTGRRGCGCPDRPARPRPSTAKAAAGRPPPTWTVHTAIRVYPQKARPQSAAATLVSSPSNERSYVERRRRESEGREASKHPPSSVPAAIRVYTQNTSPSRGGSSPTSSRPQSGSPCSRQPHASISPSKSAASDRPFSAPPASHKSTSNSANLLGPSLAGSPSALPPRAADHRTQRHSNPETNQGGARVGGDSDNSFASSSQDEQPLILLPHEESRHHHHRSSSLGNDEAALCSPAGSLGSLPRSSYDTQGDLYSEPRSSYESGGRGRDGGGEVGDDLGSYSHAMDPSAGGGYFGSRPPRSPINSRPMSAHGHYTDFSSGMASIDESSESQDFTSFSNSSGLGPGFGLLRTIPSMEIESLPMGPLAQVPEEEGDEYDDDFLVEEDDEDVEEDEWGADAEKLYDEDQGWGAGDEDPISDSVSESMGDQSGEIEPAPRSTSPLHSRGMLTQMTSVPIEKMRTPRHEYQPPSSNARRFSRPPDRPTSAKVATR